MKKLKNKLNYIFTIFNNSKRIHFFKNFVMMVLFYGVIINFALSRFVKGLTFSISNIIACGIISYCIKEEIPEIINDSKKR